MLSIIATVSTIMVMITFIAIVIWAWSGKRKKDFDEAARLPLDENLNRENNHG